MCYYKITRKGRIYRFNYDGHDIYLYVVSKVNVFKILRICSMNADKSIRGDYMKTVNIQIAVPEDMRSYLDNEDPEQIFERNAMFLYPFIRDLTISHGRAAEILGVHKTDLIEFYDSLGIPYLDQGEEELMEDLATLDRLMGVEK